LIEALADEVLKKLKDQYKIIGKIEGHSHDGWLVIDLGDLVLHLFTPDQRDYYKLEHLWLEGKVLLHLQ
jgi:ribosome-associated protein